MSTLIIPAAGRSTRFPNMKPKWMLTHPDGTLMIEKSLAGMPLNKFDRIIITIGKEHTKEYDAKLILEQVFNTKKNKKIEILELDNLGTGHADAVYQTVVKKKVTGSFVSKDCDNHVEIKKFPSTEFVVGLNVSTFPKEISRLKTKSFLVVNDQRIIVDIIEKRISSEYICLGVYGFESAEKFKKAFEALTKDSKGDHTGVYLSHVISYLIGTHASVYSYAEASDYEDWGTLDDWKIIQARHSTYFLDIDGILLKNKGKYGKENWSNSLPLLEENIKAVKKLYDTGAQIIITTSRGEKHLSEFKKVLKKFGITPHAFVTNCNHAPRILVNDFAPTNPHPSCTAINVPRNGSLETYLP